ncbi:hypothetical protein ACIBO1_18815 [Micromonospora sp. NPDC049903]|uniref:hypothetical protein n=1 Tax=Micromonospora sp. NPDC049903 TaxID=3364276 RepID=UPI0037B34CFC
MGTDIDGGVEVRPGGAGSPWSLADVLTDDLPRDYDAFGLLFGVRNYAGFTPVAPGRGLPEDASPELRRLRTVEPVHDCTWVTWAEVARIDWTASAPRVDDRIHEYRPTSAGEVLVGKASHHGRAWHAVAGEHADPRGSSYPEGTQWRTSDRVWRVERLRTGDVLRRNPQLRALLAGMRGLAERHGDDHVRLVVWFDS